MKGIRQRQQDDGLIGLFGHTYIDDPDKPSVKMIQFQFRIIRKMEGDRYVIQYFSWLDGSATKVGVMPEAELLGESVKLYANAELWNAAYETSHKHNWRNSA
jgi:hypothetical protein